ncbi:aspartate/glutamate racemase family protein [Shimia biformata]|uniref:maleate cis-trans isomerase family protein n=1 Tax=Shimia biformata TaxID=1294299 RepID=UPI00194EB802|nr:aspartate/glutamate racemase family protein [Shimia biformata]
MTGLPYRLTTSIGSTATLGLIVLQADETIEQDFRQIFRSPDIALHVSRIPSGAELTPDTIAQMEVDLPTAASLFPAAAQFDAIGYACTSGTTLIGADRVAQLVADRVAAAMVTNPLTAAIAAFRALQVQRIGIVSPYVATVAGPVRDAFLSAGFVVSHTLSFGERIEARVARIDPASIRQAAHEIGRHRDVDAVFLSCTNLRTLGIIDNLEQTLGKPVVSSNQALAWHMAGAGRDRTGIKGPGMLFR